MMETNTNAASVVFSDGIKVKKNNTVVVSNRKNMRISKSECSKLHADVITNDNENKFMIPKDCNPRRRRRPHHRQIPEQQFLIPELLLAYTYFLNPEHSCFIRIGYDIESFNLKIILKKGQKFQVWSFDDWFHLQLNAIEIQNFFVGVAINDAISSAHHQLKAKSSCMQFRMLKQQNKKYLLFSNPTDSAIKISNNEWEKLYALSGYINSIACHCHAYWPEIRRYYDAYLTKCNVLQVTALPGNEFFIFADIYMYCNYSRLFNEISILCADKIKHDFFVNCSNTN